MQMQMQCEFIYHRGWVPWDGANVHEDDPFWWPQQSAADDRSGAHPDPGHSRPHSLLRAHSILICSFLPCSVSHIPLSSYFACQLNWNYITLINYTFLIYIYYQLPRKILHKKKKNDIKIEDWESADRNNGTQNLIWGLRSSRVIPISFE